MISIKNRAPKHDLIELTAARFAGEFYNIGRSQGMTSKYKSDVAYAKAMFEKFIPAAVEHLTTLLGMPTINDHMKNEIYEALMERVNDPELQALHKIETLPDIDIKKLLDNSPLPPIKIDAPKFSSIKEKLKNGVSV